MRTGTDNFSKKLLYEIQLIKKNSHYKVRYTDTPLFNFKTSYFQIAKFPFILPSEKEAYHPREKYNHTILRIEM